MLLASLLVVSSLALVSAELAPCSTTTIPSSFVTPVIDSASIPKYRPKLPNPLHPSMIFTPDRTTYGPGVDYYEIGMRQVTQQILPAGCPSTSVWGYGNAKDPLNNPVSFHSPSKTIVAFKNRPVKVKWNHTQLPSTHLFPIDRTFHCGSAANCSPDVRTVVHLHGAHVEDKSDGFPDAWMAPNGAKGTLYEEVYTYDNSQEGATLWYHDHSVGTTRLNVYAGLAGFYILRGNREMSLQSLNKLPRYPYDVPILIQDRNFRPNGALAYPDAPFTAPRLMNTQFGNVFMVNGVAWPRMLVERRKYRFRLLNGCNSRFLAMRFVSNQATNPSVLPVWQVMSDGGLLNGPVSWTNQTIVISPAERFDLVVDFAAARIGERFELTNSAATPYPFGTAIPAGDPMSTIMQFRVKFEASPRIPMTANPPVVLRNRAITLPPPSVLNSYPLRKLVLADKVYIGNGITRLRRAMGTNELGGLDFCDEAGVTETPAVNATEVWEIYNPTGETHPIHLHLVMFRVISIHNFVSAPNPTTGVLNFNLGATTFPVPPEDGGWKDTVRIDPGRAVRIVSTFDRPGLYVWHCHLLEHEDYDMMRPICVGGNCPTAWADMSTMPW
jgi:spore coat protein A, manganese oxidase